MNSDPADRIRKVVPNADSYQLPRLIRPSRPSQLIDVTGIGDEEKQLIEIPGEDEEWEYPDEDFNGHIKEMSQLVGTDTAGSTRSLGMSLEDMNKPMDESWENRVEQQFKPRMAPVLFDHKDLEKFKASLPAKKIRYYYPEFEQDLVSEFDQEPIDN